MRKREVVACSIHRWLRIFKDVSVDTRLIALTDPKFLAYLIGEGEATLRLPRGKEAKDADDDDNDEVSGSDEGFADQGDDDEDDLESPSFPEIESVVHRAIEELGGAVIPKLNWSAPRDATWISHDKSLRCSDFNEILLLMKSSDFVLRDLTEPFVKCDDDDENDDDDEDKLFLTLRRWRDDIRPSSEFRCFVADRELIAVSQRHDDVFFPSILEGEGRIVEGEGRIVARIRSFVDEFVASRFELKTFVADICLMSQGRPLLIDLGPWGHVTDPLLFTWSELTDIRLGVGQTLSTPEFRFVDSESGVKPSKFSFSAMPLDFQHLVTGEDPNKLVDFLDLARRRQSEEEDERT